MTPNEKGDRKAIPDDANPGATGSASDSPKLHTTVSTNEGKHNAISAVMNAIEDAEFTMPELAEMYGKAGLVIFPADPRTKRPLCKWKEGATSDSDHIRRWWRKHPDAMIGLPAGKDNGFWVVDLDKKEGVSGLDNLVSLCEAQGEELSDWMEPGFFDHTLIVQTPSGGFHAYFQYADGRDIRNTASQIGDGIDVRNDGGYVVAPGSKNAANEVYKQFSDATDITPAPDWVVVIAENPPSKKATPKPDDGSNVVSLWGFAGHGYTQRALDAFRDEQQILAGTVKPGRNDQLNRSAFNLFQLVKAKKPELDKKIVWDTLTTTALGTGLGKAEIETTLGSAWKKAEPRSSRPGGSPKAYVEAVDSDTPWGEADLSYGREHSVNAPEFPRDVFGLVADLLDETARSCSAPIGAVAGILLATASGLLQNARAVKVREGFTAPSVIWHAGVAGPSVKKTPALNAIMRPLEALERVLNTFFNAEKAKWDEACQVAAQHHTKWMAGVKAAVGKGEAPLPMPAAAKNPEEPLPVVLRISDGTPEKLIWRKSNQKVHGLIFEANELSGLLGKLGQKDQANLRALLLQAYDGNRFVLDQIKHGSGTQSVERLALSIVGGIQPEKLAPVIKEPDDGLFSRFDYIHMDPLFPEERYTGTGTEDEIERALQRLVGLPSGLVTVPLTDDADIAIFEMERECCGLQVDQHSLVQGWLGKAHGKAARYALLFVYLEYAFGHTDEPPVELNVEHVARARKYVLEYLYPMLLCVLGEVLLSVEETRARDLFRLLRRKYKSGEQFTVRDIQRDGISGIDISTVIGATLKTLGQGNLVRREIGEEGSKKELWRANPVIWEKGFEDV